MVFLIDRVRLCTVAVCSHCSVSKKPMSPIRENYTIRAVRIQSRASMAVCSIRRHRQTPTDRRRGRNKISLIDIVRSLHLLRLSHGISRANPCRLRTRRPPPVLSTPPIALWASPVKRTRNTSLQVDSTLYNSSVFVR